MPPQVRASRALKFIYVLLYVVRTSLVLFPLTSLSKSFDIYMQGQEPFWSYAPVYFSWKWGHLCPMDTFFHFIQLVFKYLSQRS